MSSSTFQQSGEKVPKLPSKQEGAEPVSGVKGSGAADEPFDQGNQEEMDVADRKNEGHDSREPVSGKTGNDTYDKGNEGSV